MKIIKAVSFIVTLMFFFSCADDKNTNQLILCIEAVVQNTDSINAYYMTNNSIEFNDPQSFWTKIEGSKKNQKIKIIFPDTVKPNQIRLDFGKNIANKEIILNKVSFSFLESNFEAKGEEIYWIFRVDDSNTLIDKLTGNLKRKDPKQINGPSLYPAGDKLFNKLNELYSKN